MIAKTLTSPSLQTPPMLSGGLPLLGHAIEFGRNPVVFLTRAREQCGDIFSFPLLGQQISVFLGPEASEAFFKAPDTQFSSKEAYQLMVPIFGKGIVYDTSVERMNEQLGFVFPALRDDRMAQYVQIMSEETHRYFSQWSNWGEVDLLTTMNELTIFIAGRCLIGEEFYAHLTTEFAQLYHDLEGGLNLLSFYWPYLPLPSFRRRDKARVRMVELISEVIAQRRADRTESTSENFLKVLMEAKYSDGTALNEDSITGLLITLLFAGQHTSAVLAAWTGLLLAQHRQYIPAIQQELQTIDPYGFDLTYQGVKSMTRLGNAIREAARMYPPLIMLMRKVLYDFEYDGYHFPAGSMAMVSPAVSQRMARVFTDPNRFDPDRYQPGREEHLRSRYAITAFGGGRHRCIGQGFAYQQVKIIWAYLLNHFEIELVDPQVKPSYSTLVVGPKQPCRIRYYRK